MNIPTKIYLSEQEIPTKWYNLRADMKNKPAPLISPASSRDRDQARDRFLGVPSLIAASARCLAQGLVPSTGRRPRLWWWSGGGPQPVWPTDGDAQRRVALARAASLGPIDAGSTIEGI